MARLFALSILILLLKGGISVLAHDTVQLSPAGRWLFVPEYTLPRKASNHPGPREPYPATPYQILDKETHPILFHGQSPTERIGRLLPKDELPTNAFTVELWLVDHVNQPVGTLVSVKGPSFEAAPAWAIGYYNRSLHFTVRSNGSNATLKAASTQGWKRYWRHIVGTFDGRNLRLFQNGEQVGAMEVDEPLKLDAGSELEMAAYLSSEPHMKLGNILREASIYREALPPEQIKHRFEHLQELVEEGIVFEGRFHFTAGPYLNLVTQNSIRLLWETDRPSSAQVLYWKSLPLMFRKEIGELNRIQEITLENLETESNYFYEVVADDGSGKQIRSGVLTFQTAVQPGSPYSFAVIGDTEARPHINDVIAKGVWAERPNFMVLVGDLTDGGQKHHKFEWNLEYFLGMNQIISRVPTLTVPGNGESDLHWYNRYHSLPLPKNFYSFEYGNAEFFMLDSNQPMGPGTEQHSWLEKQLKRSQAYWKFACHHHPAYSSDDDDYGDTWKGESNLGDLKVRSLVPLYEKYKVDAVFYGHIHGYERTWPISAGRVNLQRGVRYIQTGGAGGNLEDFAPHRNWFTTTLHHGHHYCIVRIFEGQMRFQMYDTEGRLKDSFEIAK